MPENETLIPDARTANRWQPLKDRIARGEAPGDMFPDFQKQFILGLQAALKRWKKRGVEPKQLFEAARNGDSSVLRDFVNQTGNDKFARLLRDAVTGNMNLTDEAVIGLFLRAYLDVSLDNVQIHRCERGVNAFLKLANHMLERLTRSLLKNPSRIPRLLPNKNAPPDIDDMLGESLPRA